MKQITIAALSWKRYLQKEVLPHGITLKQRYVLQQLEKKGVLYPSEVADILFCDRPTATVVIKNMEKQKWVIRKLDPEDSRRIRITLGKAGQAKLNSVVNVLLNQRGQPFDPLSCFTGSEKDKLSALLDKLNQHLQQLNKENSS